MAPGEFRGVVHLKEPAEPTSRTVHPKNRARVPRAIRSSPSTRPAASPPGSSKRRPALPSPRIRSANCSCSGPTRRQPLVFNRNIGTLPRTGNRRPRLWVTGDTQVFRLVDALGRGRCREGHDALFVPQVAYLPAISTSTTLWSQAHGSAHLCQHAVQLPGEGQPAHSFIRSGSRISSADGRGRPAT